LQLLPRRRALQMQSDQRLKGRERDDLTFLVSSMVRCTVCWMLCMSPLALGAFLKTSRRVFVSVLVKILEYQKR
jgi:hypothetical protein